ncbi:hypothetical protein [Deinococcus sp.]|uniref:hypothetical protein n=1 Tax=Deinococcus sp. TaxID=47478 RepID=UPI003B5C6966
MNATDPAEFFEATIQQLIANARRDQALAQAEGDRLTAIKARVRLDTLDTALKIHRAGFKVAERQRARS